MLHIQFIINHYSLFLSLWQHHISLSIVSSSTGSTSSKMQEEVLMECLLSLDPFMDLVHFSVTIFLWWVFHSSHKITLISRIKVRMVRLTNKGVEKDMVEELQELLTETQLHPPDKRQSWEAGFFRGFSAKILSL